MRRGAPTAYGQHLMSSVQTELVHGIRAIDDSRLMAFLLENKIGLEMNITSNVQTSSVASFKSHPIKEFIEQGLLATINTDDPVISGIDLRHEYNVAAPAAGMSVGEIRQAQLNAVQIAFLDGKEKSSLLEKKLLKIP